MRIVIRLKRHRNMVRVSVFLVTVAVIAGMVGCEPIPGPTPQYNLYILSTFGGSVTDPGEGMFLYDEAEEVDLVAVPNLHYHFVEWTGDVGTVADVYDPTTTIDMDDSCFITANFELDPGWYSLTVSSTEGGSVTTPGETPRPRGAPFVFGANTTVDIIAEPGEGCQFLEWIGDVGTIGNTTAVWTTITMNDNYTITASFALGIWDWYDLDAIRDNLPANYILNYILMNDLDSTSAGYEELAGPAANGGYGWEPIRFYFTHDELVGTFDGQGYEIRDLSINQTYPWYGWAALFRYVGVGGVIKNVGVVNVAVSSEGNRYVGALAAVNEGTISNSYATGTVSGGYAVGGLVGRNYGTVSGSYADCSVSSDDFCVGGLVGDNPGTVSDSYSTGNVVGYSHIGGLIGQSCGSVSNSYSVGNVTGVAYVSGLVGVSCLRTVANSFWDTHTSGQATSDGGTGKNTTEMQNIATFSGAGWDISAVAPGSTNSTYIWNIVDDVTYPFLSWEPVS